MHTNRTLGCWDVDTLQKNLANMALWSIVYGTLVHWDFRKLGWNVNNVVPMHRIKRTNILSICTCNAYRWDVGMLVYLRKSYP